MLYYPKEWKGMGDWLGTGRVASQNMEFLPFDKAKEFVHSLVLKSQTEWGKYCKSGNRPKDIPSNPHDTYRKYWKGYGDWLGTGAIAILQRECRPFEQAREYIRKLGLNTQEEWRNYRKSGKKPPDI